MKCWTYSIEHDMDVYFASETPHCPSCLSDHEEGYGESILGCCCVHNAEAESTHIISLPGAAVKCIFPL